MQEFEKCKSSNGPQKLALKKKNLHLKKKTCTFFSTLALKLKNLYLTKLGGHVPNFGSPLKTTYVKKGECHKE
jgi:hypothetical protein